jgi:hypothetical protein
MMKIPLPCLAMMLLLACVQPLMAEDSGKHLFILSGQSNMKRLDPAVSFTPAVATAFGQDNVIVVHDAEGGTEIGAWLLPEPGTEANKKAGRYYKRLMEKVDAAIENKTLASVTFVWMQGERDSNANVMNGDGYSEDLQTLISQLRADLGRDDLNVVIGRLSDFGFTKKGKMKYPDWEKVRNAQVALAESNPRYAWINTDNLNDGFSKPNDLHADPEGYKIMGQRFADAAVKLIRQHQP